MSAMRFSRVRPLALLAGLRRVSLPPAQLPAATAVPLRAALYSTSREPSTITPEDFNNAKDAFKSKSNQEIRRAWFVYKLLSFNTIVNNSEKLLQLCRTILGKGVLFDKLMKTTIYGQFVAGNDLDAVKPVASSLKTCGVYSIYDYAVEEDVADKDTSQSTEILDDSKKKASETVMRNFMQCIDTSAAASEGSDPFVAIKLTGICDSKFLLNFSEYLTGMEKIFKVLSDSTTLFGHITPHSFKRGMAQMGFRLDEQEIDQLFKEVDVNSNGKISLCEWQENLHSHMRIYHVLRNRQESREMLVDFEREELDHAVNKVGLLVEHAQNKGVCVLVDAEQTYLQPAISHITVNRLMPRFNQHRPILFNTIQGYLKESEVALQRDLAFAKSTCTNSRCYGVKLVRGAYMEQEREKAKKDDYESPIWETKEDTDNHYHKLLGMLMKEMQSQSNVRIHVMVATHNETSVLFATNKMEQYGIDRTSGRVVFGQLLGMCDHVTFPLGNAGYKVYKYLPYGPVNEVIPYLIRRSQENSALLGSESTKKMRKMLSEEMKRRYFG